MTTALFDTPAGTLAFGLQWRDLIGEEATRTETARLVKDTKAKGKILLQGPGRAVAGLWLEKMRSRKLLSGAAWLSGLAPHGRAIFWLELPDGRVALIRSLDGLPLGGGDVVESAEVARLQLEETFASSVEGVTQLKLFVIGHGLAIDQISHYSIYIEIVELGEGAFAWPQGDSAIVIQSTSPLPYVLAALGVLSVALLGGGYAYMDRIQKEMEARRRAREQDPVVIYAATIDSKLQSAAAEWGAATIRRMRGALDEIPVLAGGWKVMEVSCKGENCGWAWVPIQGGMPFASSLLAARPPQRVTLNTDGRSAQEGISLPALVPAAAAPEKLVANSRLVPQIRQLLQFAEIFGGNYSLEAPSVFGWDAGGAPPPTLQRRVDRGNWRFEGPLHTLELFENLPEGATVEQLVIGLPEGSADAKVRIEGKYYVRG